MAGQKGCWRSWNKAREKLSKKLAAGMEIFSVLLKLYILFFRLFLNLHPYRFILPHRLW